MKKRHLQLIRILNRGVRYTAQELAFETGASLRTIQRDMKKLEELGYPIWSVSGIGGGYEMLPNRLLPPLHLREQEAVALYLTLKWMEQIPDVPFGDMRQTLADWYVQAFPKDIERRITHLEQNILWIGRYTGPPAPFTKEVYQAVDQRRKLEMTYETTKGIRCFSIDPIGMSFQDMRWYVFGMSDYGLRQYRIDRIQHVRLLEERFEHKSLETMLKQSDARSVVTVRLELTTLGRRLLEDVLSDIWGKNEWDVPEAELPFLSRQLLMAGAEVKVIAPKELCKMMREQAERLWHIYN